MATIYHKIDSEFLQKLNPNAKDYLNRQYLSSLKSDQMRNSKQVVPGLDKIKTLDELVQHLNRNAYILYCPYCGVFGLLTTSLEVEAIRCPFCSESNPHIKLNKGLEKASKLYNLAISQGCGGDEQGSGRTSLDPPTFCVNMGGGGYDQVSEEIGRIVLEQCLVSMATAIEVFLKEFYSLVLNVRFVIPEKSLYLRFYQERRNDFINIGKTKKLFQNDLDINLEELVGNDALKQINLLMLKRNNIVHNLGIVDNIFKTQSGIDCEIKRKLPISSEDIEEYMRVIRHVGAILGEILSDEVIKRLNNRLDIMFYKFENG